MTKLIYRKLMPWTIAYASIDHDEIHIDERFEYTYLIIPILEHEIRHIQIGNNMFKQIWFDIIDFSQWKTIVKSIKYKPSIALMPIFGLILMWVDEIEFRLWRKKNG